LEELEAKLVSGTRYDVFEKDYLEYEGSIKRVKPKTVLFGTDFSTDGATKNYKKIMSSTEFPNPKPLEFVQQLVSYATSDDDIVLDSFAGSGTTAHAVMAQNKEDGGNRKFILVEMEDYANTITAERVRRAVKRDEYKSGFTYYKLGPSIDAETMLSGDLPDYKQFAKYVYYLATSKDHPEEKKIDESTYFVGQAEHDSIYLVYKKDMEELKKLAITLDWAETTQKKDKGRKIVYAPACYLDEEALEKYQIKFVSIPYNLFERNEI
jgi:adenine-specific DNA-methyltransferase